MVNTHYKSVVKKELNKFGLHFIIADLGAVDIMENITEEQREQIRIALLKSGLELMDAKKAELVEKVTDIITEMIHHTDELYKTNLPDYLSKKLDYDYTYLASIFSEGHGTTIEEFINYQKIERIKELIIYDELTLTEIARKMDYSSVGHLYSQFKKVTGLTTSHFKNLNNKRRILVEEVRD
jgi:YesN/AraC family two-component response regulator